VGDCTTHGDCDDGNPCTEDICSQGECVHEDLANGTPCPDDLFCNGDETCQSGSCEAGAPRNCDDGLSCTGDVCIEAHDECLHVPARRLH
jgi:hypothetical protein